LAKAKIKKAAIRGGSKRKMKVTAGDGKSAYELLENAGFLFNYAGGFGMD
jgi:hypothetical protein